MNVRKRERVVIEGVQPEIDCGRFPIKLTVGETVAVEADIFTDGRDALADVLRYRSEDEPWAGVRAGPPWSGAGRRKLRLTAGLLEAKGKAAIEAALDPELTRLMHAAPERRHMATHDTELEVVADRECARFGALYELFPHSTSLRVRG